MTVPSFGQPLANASTAPLLQADAMVPVSVHCARANDARQAFHATAPRSLRLDRRFSAHCFRLQQRVFGQLKNCPPPTQRSRLNWEAPKPPLKQKPCPHSSPATLAHCVHRPRPKCKRYVQCLDSVNNVVPSSGASVKLSPQRLDRIRRHRTPFSLFPFSSFVILFSSLSCWCHGAFGGAVRFRH